MTRRNLKFKYERGKQVISLSVIVVSLLGFVLDAITYHSLYSNIQIWLQSVTTVLCAFSLIYYSLSPKRNYRQSFSLVCYGVIVNILLTATIISTFLHFENFNETNILTRDTFFIIIYIVLASFILGRGHIFSQGLLLITFMIYILVVKQDVFFKQNAAVFLTTIVGFLYVLYFLVGIVNDLITGLEESNVRTNRLKQAEMHKKLTVLKYQNELLGLARDQSLFKGDLNALFKKVCVSVSGALDSSRVSIWAMESDNSQIVRKHLFERPQGNDDAVSMERKDFPIYFQAIEENAFVLANHAQEHPATMEFNEAYLKPLSIVSMLDCPIRLNGKTVGVICCENQQTLKDWGTEDVIFVQAMAEHISICYKNIEINYLLSQINERNRELEEKTGEIETMNEELLAVNETLERAVAKRTSELETQNKQLTEYAFINSHILRAPLARILGLCYLITLEATSVRDVELLRALKHSSEEFDLVIRKISDLLYDGNNLSRNDINNIIEKNISKSLREYLN